MNSLSPLYDYFLNALKNFVSWMLNLGAGLFPNYSDIRSNLPSGYFDFSTVLDGSSFAYLYLWFPVDYAITCFMLYIALACLVYLVNWILGAIPTLS